MVSKRRRIRFHSKAISGKLQSKLYVVIRDGSHRADDVRPRREGFLSYPLLAHCQHSVEVAFPISVEGASFSGIRYVLDLPGRHDLAAQVRVGPFSLGQRVSGGGKQAPPEKFAGLSVAVTKMDSSDCRREF